jgi:uroporphyrinogen decarboxylase
MKPKQVILKAFDGGKPDRVPVALMGGGMWGAYHYETTLKDLSTDAAKMTDMIVSMAHKLQSDIVYVGSGYPNVLAAALGGKNRHFKNPHERDNSYHQKGLKDDKIQHR